MLLPYLSISGIGACSSPTRKYPLGLGFEKSRFIWKGRFTPDASSTVPAQKLLSGIGRPRPQLAHNTIRPSAAQTWIIDTIACAFWTVHSAAADTLMENSIL